MKKVYLLLLGGLLALGLVGCGAKDPKKLVVGASTTPHAEILEVIKESLSKDGYELDIVEFSDYVLPNLGVEDGSLDANFFQHQPYLDSFNEENGTNLVSVATVHYEPFGIYGGKIDSIDALTEGSQIAVPNDTTNEARALLLLEANGIIKLKENAGLFATINDIVENPKNVKIIEVEAAQLPRTLPDVDLAVINGNYAISAGLSVGNDALVIEDKESISATTYGNVIAIKTGDENREDIKALIKALQSEEVKAFIEEKYDGAVVPMF